MHGQQISPPLPEEYGAPYARYVERVPTDASILDELVRQRDQTRARFASVAEGRGAHRYAPGKWSVRQVVAHLSDAERIFAYRALRFARGDSTPLPGFEENAYAEQAGADAQSLAALVTEWGQVREASIVLFRHLPPGAWTRPGTASGMPATVRALAWIIAGHTRHHLGSLAERYGLWATPEAER